MVDCSLGWYSDLYHASFEYSVTLDTRTWNNNWDIRSLREAIAKEMYIQEAGNHNSFEMVTPTASFHAGTVICNLVVTETVEK
jgi:predicted nuclease of restriction endonuclease-like (RecB) superfamily